MKPKELRRRALEIIEKAEDECPKPEAFKLLLTAEQLLVAAEEIEEMGDTIEPGEIAGGQGGEDR